MRFAATGIVLFALVGCSDAATLSTMTGGAGQGGVNDGSGGAATGGGSIGGMGGEAGVCTPGSVEACYSGAAGTADVGLCRTGTRSCAADGSSWGNCLGEVLPTAEDCTTAGVDDDCNGVADDSCICAPGTEAPCYTGAPATEDVGLCKGGTAICAADGKSYGSCDGEVLPVAQMCHLPLLDEDCDGALTTGCCISGQWSFAPIDHGVSHLLVDDAGTLHGVTPGLASNVWYSRRPRAGSWVEEAGSIFAVNSAVAFDFQQRPHAVYSYGNEFYSRRTGPNQTWVETPGPPEIGQTLVVDSSGSPITGVRQYGAVSVYQLLAGSWHHTQFAMPGTIGGEGIALETGPDGRTHLAYPVNQCPGCSAATLYYVVGTAGSWSTPTAITSVQGDQVAIAPDDLGNPWLVYLNIGNALEVRSGPNFTTTATCPSTICPTLVPYSSGESIFYLSSVYHEGALHMVFRSSQGVHYVRYDGVFHHSLVTTSLAGLSRVAIDSQGAVNILLGHPVNQHAYRCP